MFQGGSGTKNIWSSDVLTRVIHGTMLINIWTHDEQTKQFELHATHVRWFPLGFNNSVCAGAASFKKVDASFRVSIYSRARWELQKVI